MQARSGIRQQTRRCAVMMAAAPTLALAGCAAAPPGVRAVDDDVRFGGAASMPGSH